MMELCLLEKMTDLIVAKIHICIINLYDIYLNMTRGLNEQLEYNYNDAIG